MEKTEQTLLLVDGHNLLFKMFYGMPARIVNREGRAIQGTLGFVGALLRIVRWVRCGHVAVIFDGQHENLRRDITKDYKANRPDFSQVPEEENPFSSFRMYTGRSGIWRSLSGRRGSMRRMMRLRLMSMLMGSHPGWKQPRRIRGSSYHPLTATSFS